jgi:hypothetical protein
VLAYGFTENHQFAAKTDRNSVFHGCDPRIMDRLHVMVTDISFDGFQKFKGLSLQLQVMIPYLSFYGF